MSLHWLRTTSRNHCLWTQFTMPSINAGWSSHDPDRLHPLWVKPHLNWTEAKTVSWSDLNPNLKCFWKHELCSFQTKEERSIQLVISRQFKSLHVWWYGAAFVTLWVTCWAACSPDLWTHLAHIWHTQQENRIPETNGTFLSYTSSSWVLSSQMFTDMKRGCSQTSTLLSQLFCAAGVKSMFCVLLWIKYGFFIDSLHDCIQFLLMFSTESPFFKVGLYFMTLYRLKNDG